MPEWKHAVGFTPRGRKGESYRLYPTHPRGKHGLDLKEWWRTLREQDGKPIKWTCDEEMVPIYQNQIAPDGATWWLADCSKFSIFCINLLRLNLIWPSAA